MFVKLIFYECLFVSPCSSIIVLGVINLSTELILTVKDFLVQKLNP